MAISGMSGHHQYTFDDFRGLPDWLRKGKEEAAELCERLVNDGITERDGLRRAGIILVGNYGVGKTTLATSAGISAGLNGISILRIKAADFIHSVQTAEQNERNRAFTDPPRDANELTADQIEQAARAAQLLIVDDLGDPGDNATPMTPPRRRILHGFLEYRLENILPTIITTNLDRRAMSWQISEQTAQRVYELCHEVKVTGDPIRRL